MLCILLVLVGISSSEYVNWLSVLLTTHNFQQAVKTKIERPCCACSGQIVWLIGGPMSRMWSCFVAVFCKSCRIKELFSMMTNFAEGPALIEGLSLIHK